MKYVVITGGVVSGLGKGITASSVGLLLKECGLRVTAIKIDPYLNIDAGTMSPYEHGEVFVLDDGGEVDLDLGNYERFMDVRLTRDHNITTGKVYQKVIEKEREGAYLGKTVQMIPHITNEIQNWISRVANICVSKNEFDDSSNNKLINNNDLRPEVCIIELGGTVGDIESSVFLEALRQFQFRVGRDNFCHIHVSLIPVLGNVGEQKSKPTQHSMQSLRACGLIPNLIVCRCKNPIDRNIAEKVSLFSMVPFSHVVSVHDVSNIYFVPNLLLKQGVVSKVLDSLKIHRMPPINIGKFDELALKLKAQSEFEIETKEHENEIENNIENDIENENENDVNVKNSKNENKKNTISIGIVGKYTGLSDSYLSVTKALLSASLNCDLKLKIVWIESSHLEYYNGKNSNSNSCNSISNINSNCSNSKVRQSRSRSGSASSSNGKRNSKLTKSNEEPPNKRQKLMSSNFSNFDDTDSNSLAEAGSEYFEYLTNENVSYECKTKYFEFLNAWEKLKKVDGILIPGGFGDRGIEGKIAACKYARTKGIPFLGICLGMQMAVIEYARNVCKINDCNSEEIDSKCKNKCVIFMPEMLDQQLGGTMRLGERVCQLTKNSLVYCLYNDEEKIYERHRHRYEVNPDFINILEKFELKFTGKDDTKQRMEVIELNTKIHPFYLGCQFHPEFKSGPLRPSPPFTGLIKAAAGILETQIETDNEHEENLDANEENVNDNDNENGSKNLEKEKNKGKNSETENENESTKEKDGKKDEVNVLSSKNLNISFETDDKQSETVRI